MTTLIISDKDINKIMKIVKYLAESGLLTDSASKTRENKVKEQKGGFLSMLLGKLGATLLRNLSAGKGVIQAATRTIRTSLDF